ncbi:hypothetical protein [Pseudomonas syringae]|uniref:hypothetical protein n=1 Tax=Pseudomonas syringae TaxID=317 RepID=UPI001F26B1E5|nr:hypothetical protein [Pseudomonas syringae]MCF5723902.1 hypothetical protein [Pseudomonas syringae]
MTDYTELKRLAEAFPADLDWDSNSEPFFNGPSGESLGGGPTGFYCVYGPAFEIDDEQYDGPTYVESCKVDFAKFMVAARDGVLALIAENERLERKNASQSESIREYQDLIMGGDVSLGMLKADIRVTTGERDELRAEVAGLKTGYEAYERVNAELKAENEALRKDAERYRYLRDRCGLVEYKAFAGSIGPGMLPSGEALDAAIDAAMGKGDRS